MTNAIKKEIRIIAHKLGKLSKGPKTGFNRFSKTI
jgi:hypothetical protein|tara:strand:+ start:1597 stop:1701 length:105 start_codon:yes stop_codon:yes gene_type:complete